jgi:hypothetical protein
MDAFYPSGMENEFKEDFDDKLGFTNTYAKIPVPVNELHLGNQLFRNDDDLDAQIENRNADEDKVSQQSNQIDTIADLSLTNTHPVHQKFGSIDKFFYISTVVPENKRSQYTLLCKKYNGLLLSALSVSLKMFKTRCLDIQGKHEDVD